MFDSTILFTMCWIARILYNATGSQKLNITLRHPETFFSSKWVESNYVVNKLIILWSWDAVEASTVATAQRRLYIIICWRCAYVCVWEVICACLHVLSVYCFCCFNHSACGRKAQVTDSAVEKLDSLRGRGEECDNSTWHDACCDLNPAERGTGSQGGGHLLLNATWIHLH